MIQRMNTRASLKNSLSVGRTADQQRSLIQWYYQLGKQIAREVSSGQSIGEAIKGARLEASQFTVYKAHKFAMLVKPGVELNRYLNAAAQGRFSWTHILALLQVDEPADRLRFFRRTLREGWSATRLRREITCRKTYRAASGGRRQGRPFRMPTSDQELREVLMPLLERPHNLLEEILSPEPNHSIRLSNEDRKRLMRLRSAIKATEHVGER